MSKKRTPIPKKGFDSLLYKNRHICCICREPRKNVQIHHLDTDPSNNNAMNLAVLCVDCHSRVTGDEGLGRKYSPEEVRLFKESWEKQCKIWLEGGNSDNNEEEEPDEEESIDSDYVDDVLETDSHFEFRYELEEGDGIMLWVKNDEPVYAAVMTKDNYKQWIKKKLDFTDAAEQYWEDFEELNEMFITEADDEYSVVIANFSSDEAWVQADISAWEFE